jgi:hypothetical protein
MTLVGFWASPIVQTKSKEPSNSVSYTPSSEPFTTDEYEAIFCF